MGYFQNFSLVRYEGKLGINITRGSEILRRFKEDARYYVLYSVQNNETPHIIADRMYDDAELYWVILKFNDIIDYFDEWPKSYNALLDNVNAKYDDVYGIHHYESAATGAIVTVDHPDYDRLPITNFEYEERLNERFRTIKVPVPSVIQSLVNGHNEAIGS